VNRSIAAGILARQFISLVSAKRAWHSSSSFNLRSIARPALVYPFAAASQRLPLAKGSYECNSLLSNSDALAKHMSNYTGSHPTAKHFLRQLPGIAENRRNRYIFCGRPHLRCNATIRESCPKKRYLGLVCEDVREFAH
jgi:hypothetical protein